MRRYYLTFILTFVTIGCTPDGKVRRPAQVLNQFSKSVIAGGNPLGDDEMGVALRICYALRFKRGQMLGSFGNHQFRFDIEERTCNGQEETYQWKTKLNQPNTDKELTFESRKDTLFFNKVLSDIHPPLATICKALTNGNTPMNTVEIDDHLVELRFYSKAKDYVEMRHAHKGIHHQMSSRPYKIERFQILTNKTSAGNYLGMSAQSLRLIPCNENAKEYTWLKQTLSE